MTDLIPDPIKSYAPKQPMARERMIESSPHSIDEQTLSSLQSMPKDAMISLIQRVGGAMWGVGLLTNEERREAMKLKVANIALTAKDNHTILKACNEWLDREEGKAIQRIDQRVLNVNKIAPTEMTTAELMETLRNIKQLPNGIKLLDNGMLDVTNEEAIV